jgi:hypothetical protein
MVAWLAPCSQPSCEPGNVSACQKLQEVEEAAPELVLQEEHVGQKVELGVGAALKVQVVGHHMYLPLVT